MKKWGLLLILLLSLLPRTTFAEETADAICIEGETEGLDTDAVDAATEEMDAEVSFSDLLAEILSGEFDFTFANIKEKALELTFGELRMQGRLLAQLVLIVILSAILKQCSDSFQGKNVGEGILCLLHGIDCGDSDFVLQHFTVCCGADARTMWGVWGDGAHFSGAFRFIGESDAGGSDGADADGRRDGTFRWHQLCADSCDCSFRLPWR